MRGVPLFLSLLADPLVAMKHHVLDGNQLEVDSGSRLDGLQAVTAAAFNEHPVFVPHQKAICFGPGVDQALAVDTLEIVELFPGNIGNGQVCKVNLIHCPLRRIDDFLRAFQTHAEKSELITKFSAFLIFEIAGVVPPFDAEIVMGKIVAGKRIAIPRQGLAKFSELLCFNQCKSPKQGENPRKQKKLQTFFTQTHKRLKLTGENAVNN